MWSPLAPKKARDIVFGKVVKTISESIPLMDALGRIPSTPLYTLRPEPAYSQSTFDGYVIGCRLPEQKNAWFEFKLAGEIAAGDTVKRKITGGNAFRIMTGGLVPQGGIMVIPQEVCHETRNMVRVPSDAIFAGAANIRKKGSAHRKGALIVSSGELLTPSMLCRLADAGHLQIEVLRKSKVSFFCTGNELVDSSAAQQDGLKISSNRYLLAGLIRSFGGVPDDCGTIEDDRLKMNSRLLALTESSDSDIIISTGGMGPGKYDLIEDSFTRAGGEIFFSSLLMQPGKSILFGTLGGKLYFGLPGPPPAVQALFYEMVGPALLAVQGFKKTGPEEVKAVLEKDIAVRRKAMLVLREGRISCVQGICRVRPESSGKNCNCYILCPGHRKLLRRGELVAVHSFQSPLYCPGS